MRQFFNRLNKKWSRKKKTWGDYAHVFKRFSPYIQNRKSTAVLSVAATIGYLLIRLLEPWPLKLIFDNVFFDQPLPGFLAEYTPTDDTARLNLLYILIAAILLNSLIGGWFYLFKRVMSSKLGQEVTAEIRLDLYEKIHRLCFNFHDHRRTGDLLVRLTSDIRALRQAFVNLPMQLVEEILLVVGMSVVMFFMDWELTMIALLLLPSVAVLVRKYRRPMKSAIKKQREREGNLANMASEALASIKLVQGFRQEKYEVKRFGSANKRSLRSGMKTAKLEAKLKWSADIAVGLVTAVIVAIASQRVLTGVLSPGDLIVFAAYLKTFARPLRRASRTTERATRAAASGERVLEILQTESTIKDLPEAKKAPKFKGEISFENVYFSYRENKPILNGLNLKIRSGERVAILGSTGAGKSSLVGLIPRFYDPIQGRICIDGQDVRGFTLNSLRSQISLVFQEPMLFATSIAENIAYGKPDASMEEIIHVAQRTGIHNHICRLSNGYDTIISERGRTLSGGQRQCVAIARAMMRNTPIVILDELTTGLDSRSSAKVMRALRRLIKGRTVLAITHDLHKLEKVDRVIILEGGKVIEDDKYDEFTHSDELIPIIKDPHSVV